MIGRPDSNECLRNATIMQRVCEEAGLPMEPSKSVGPSTTLVFLGIEFDSVKGELRLPEDKLVQLREALLHWRCLKACRKQDLVSLIGSLSHTAKVIRAGCIFLRRMIDLSTTAAQLHHFICLNAEARSDIEWWCKFITPWNGITILPRHVTVMQAEEILVVSDASGWRNMESPLATIGVG